MSDKKDTGIIDIHGKGYKTVALRISEFRDKYPDWTIDTEIVEITDEKVLMTCKISNTEGRLIGKGHAEELRTGQVNKFSAVENAETSAIGRALASLGYAGSEYASINEIENAREVARQVLLADVLRCIESNEGAKLLFLIAQDTGLWLRAHSSLGSTNKTAVKKLEGEASKLIADYVEQIRERLNSGTPNDIKELTEEMNKYEKSLVWSRLTQEEQTLIHTAFKGK